MKTIGVFIALWVLVAPVMAQKTIEKHMGFSGKQNIRLDLKFADSITVRTWNKAEVYAHAVVNINDNKDNDAYVTGFNESGNSVVISSNYKDGYFDRKNNCCIQSEIVWEVFIPEHVPFSVETINGNIIIEGKTKDMNVKTISGFIDLSLDPSAMADLEMSTISGTLFSNIRFSGGNRESSIPQRIREKLNQGGYPLKLETISGDIFLRTAHN
jgi:hypothetical protein